MEMIYPLKNGEVKLTVPDALSSAEAVEICEWFNVMKLRIKHAAKAASQAAQMQENEKHMKAMLEEAEAYLPAKGKTLPLRPRKKGE